MINFEKYLGSPYIAGEYDCWGLIRDIYARELDIKLNPYFVTDKKLTSKANAVYTCINKELKNRWIPVSGPFEIFDILLFDIGNAPIHVGLVIDSKYMIHLESSRVGSVIEDYTLQRWNNRLRQGYRYDKNIVEN